MNPIIELAQQIIDLERTQWELREREDITDADRYLALAGSIAERAKLTERLGQRVLLSMRRGQLLELPDEYRDPPRPAFDPRSVTRPTAPPPQPVLTSDTSSWPSETMKDRHTALKGNGADDE